MARKALKSIVVFLIALLSYVVLAQGESLNQTYVAPDNSFQFVYPDVWVLDDSNETFVLLGNGAADEDLIEVTLFGPAGVESIAGDVSDPAEALALIRNRGFDLIEPDITSTVSNGRNLAVSPVSLDERIGSAVVVEFDDGRLGFAIVVAEPRTLNNYIPLVQDIILSFNSGPEVVAIVPTATEPPTDENQTIVAPSATIFPSDTPVQSIVITATTAPLTPEPTVPSATPEPPTSTPTPPPPTATMLPPIVVTATNTPEPTLTPTPVIPTATPIRITATLSMEDIATQSGREIVVALPTQEVKGNIDNTITNDPNRFPHDVITIDPVTASAQSLRRYNQFHSFPIQELEDNGVIPFGARNVFYEDYAYYSGIRGDYLTELARREPYRNIVMGGTISFQRGDTDEYETCSLVARNVSDQRALSVRLLRVGIDSEGYLYYQDVYKGGGDNTYEAFYDLGLQPNETYHILLIAIEDKLTIYLDGQLIVKDAQIGDRAGSYGLALSARGKGAACTGTNIWVYELDSAGTVNLDECTVTADAIVNQRSRPETNSAVLDELEPGTFAEVIGQQEDLEGFVWWQLADESWVRGDVVTAVGNCADVPLL